MPHRLATPVLTVDAAKIHEVDTRSAESLHGMWMVFSKCADYMEQGRRLENLSWRLWNRETFCVPPPVTLRRPRSQRRRPESRDLPELSSSVDSVASDEADQIEKHINHPPNSLDIRPGIVSEDSVLSISRGREKHITSSGLEKMVYNIKEGKYLAPLDDLPTPISQQQIVDDTPRPSSPIPTSKPQESKEPHIVRPQQSTESCSTVPDDNMSERPAAPSDTSVSSSGLVQSASIVRGFSPSHVSSSYRSNARLSSAGDASRSTLSIKSSPLKKTKKGGMFTLGCSSDDESSFEERVMMKAPQRSSLTDGLIRSPGQPQKVASFKAEDDSMKPISESPASEDDAAIETDYEEISESAIEDDDSEWEDSVTESGRSSVDDKPLFQRVDSRPNLVSRRSLLTMMMHQPQRYGRPGGPGSRSTPVLQRSRLSSPNGPSTAASPGDYDDENTLTMKGPDAARSKPILTKPIPCHSVAHSPRTTRRNMLATELTESLRRNLLMERQQRTSSAVAFKRRHTTHDMANLQEYPGPNGAGKPVLNNSSQPSKDKETSKNSSWNHYFDYGPWEYHDKGW
ncbi:hypothetical protein VTO42DRAFT_8274 [Malbranchea cinnamomea]